MSKPEPCFTVGELIEALKAFPADANVVATWEGTTNDIRVYRAKDGTVVVDTDALSYMEDFVSGSRSAFDFADDTVEAPKAIPAAAPNVIFSAEGLLSAVVCDIEQLGAARVQATFWQSKKSRAKRMDEVAGWRKTLASDLKALLRVVAHV